MFLALTARRGPVTLDVMAARPARMVAGTIVETSTGAVDIVRESYSYVSLKLLRGPVAAAHSNPVPPTRRARASWRRAGGYPRMARYGQRNA